MAQTGAGRRRLGSKKTNSLPVYHQLYVVLRQQIVDGAHAATAPLPTEMSLAETFNVSRVTVRRALDMLERESLVVRRQGVGTFPATQAAAAEAPARISGLVENLITIGLETTAKLLVYDARASMPAFVAVALRLPPDQRCLRLERLRRHKKKPVSLTTVYVPPTFAKHVDRKSLDDRPVVQILEQAGIRAVSAEQSLGAIAADDHAAAALGVAIGSPLIRLRRVVFAKDGTPLLFQQSLYNPDRYEYYMRLSRDNSTARPQWRHLG
ncbi:MAG: GntR family transcriptional regulator [Rhodospirillales bacterium]|nr:GntR family transcriptional regulator [Rhodospirillales bacterium]